MAKDETPKKEEPPVKKEKPLDEFPKWVTFKDGSGASAQDAEHEAKLRSEDKTEPPDKTNKNTQDVKAAKERRDEHSRSVAQAEKEATARHEPELRRLARQLMDEAEHMIKEADAHMNAALTARAAAEKARSLVDTILARKAEWDRAKRLTANTPLQKSFNEAVQKEVDKLPHRPTEVFGTVPAIGGPPVQNLGAQ